MKIYKIYSLNDPITNEIRYIGYTSLTLQERLMDHLRDSRYRDIKSYKCNWLRKLEKQGLIPNIELIHNDILNLNETLDLERYYIEKYKKDGCNLTNSTNGGESSKSFNEEVKKRISEGIKKYYKNNDSYNKGKKMIDVMGEKRYKEYIKKVSDDRKITMLGENNPFYGREHTDETKKKISERNKKHHLDIEEIKYLYLIVGLKQKEIAKKLGMNNSYICRLLKRNGIVKEKEICPYCNSDHVHKAEKNKQYCLNCHKMIKTND